MAIRSINRGRLLNQLWIKLAALSLGALGSCAGVVHAGYAAIVVDPASGQVLSAVNPDQQNYPASLVKLMTLYLTFRNLESGKLRLDQQLPVSAWAAGKAPTKLGLRRGQSIAVRDCILGMVTKSANDAATVVAEGLGGSEDHFAELMNAQARQLGMSGTHFHNASGLPDPDNATTARDMAKLAMAIYHDFPQYTHYFATKEFMFRGQLVRGHNHLMDRYPGMDGLKTGFTDASGFNLTSTAVRDNHRLFGVVLGGYSATARDNLMARLLDDGFDHRQTPAEVVAQAGVTGGGVAHRVWSALSPIATAEADTAPATQRHYRRGKKHVAVARAACTPRKGAGCLRRKQVASSGKQLASHAKSAARPGKKQVGATKLVRRHVKKTAVVASRSRGK